MKILLYAGLALWFFGWLYAWVVVWAGIDIWRWARRKKLPAAGSTTITLDGNASKAFLKSIRRGYKITVVDTASGEMSEHTIESRRGNTLRITNNN